MNITEEQFEEQFIPFENHIIGENNAPMNGWGFETFSEELEYVQKINTLTPNRVWTVVDTCPDEEDENDCGMKIIAGYHHVNRLLYVITQHEWTDEMTTVILD